VSILHEQPKSRIDQFTAERRAKGAAASAASAKNPDRVDHPATSERVYTDGEAEFIKAVREWQERTGKKFLAHSEFFGVMLSLGYSK
jgi:hypothetical protein